MTDRIHDGRQRHWFYIDNVIMDDYAPKIGPIGVAVYMALVRHANASGKAYPSLRRLAQLLGVTRPTIIKYLELLQHHGLIAAEHRLSQDGDPSSNLYTILALPSPPSDQGGKPDLPPSKADIPEVVKEIDHGGQAGLPEGLKSLKDCKDLGRGARARACTPTHRCPVDYRPGVELRDWAAAKYPAIDFEEALEAMRDCEFTNAHSDWDATLRTWIRREAKARGSQAPRSTIRRGQALEEYNWQSTLRLEELLNGHQRCEDVRRPHGSTGPGVPPRDVTPHPARLLARIGGSAPPGDRLRLW